MILRESQIKFLQIVSVIQCLYDIYRTLAFAQLAISGRVTIKTLPQKPEPIVIQLVIQQINEHLGSICAIHYPQPELNPG